MWLFGTGLKLGAPRTSAPSAGSPPRASRSLTLLRSSASTSAAACAAASAAPAAHRACGPAAAGQMRCHAPQPPRSAHCCSCCQRSPRARNWRLGDTEAARVNQANGRMPTRCFCRGSWFTVQRSPTIKPTAAACALPDVRGKPGAPSPPGGGSFCTLWKENATRGLSRGKKQKVVLCLRCLREKSKKQTGRQRQGAAQPLLGPYGAHRGRGGLGDFLKNPVTVVVPRSVRRGRCGWHVQSRGGTRHVEGAGRGIRRCICCRLAAPAAASPAGASRHAAVVGYKPVHQRLYPFAPIGDIIKAGPSRRSALVPPPATCRFTRYRATSTDPSLARPHRRAAAVRWGWRGRGVAKT